MTDELTDASMMTFIRRAAETPAMSLQAVLDRLAGAQYSRLARP